MKFRIVTVIALALAAAMAVPASAAVRTKSKTLRVETPASNPQLTVENPQGLYLHMTGDGRALLYVENVDGRSLTVLDVTTPSEIRRIADAALTPASPFDFVKAVGDNAVLIRYRDGSGFALLNLSHDRRPVLEANASIAQAASFQALGKTGMLESIASAASDPTQVARTYHILGTATNGTPHVLATIPGVTQQATNSETGTVFLLNRRGVTVVRRLRVEQEHEAELTREEGN